MLPLCLMGLTEAELTALASEGALIMEKSMPSPMPSIQEAIRMMMWAMLGYMVAQGWLTEDLVTSVGTIGLAGITFIWRMMAGSDSFPNVK